MDPRYSLWQAFFGWWPWTPKWTCPPADSLERVRQDTRFVRGGVAQDWPEELRDLPVRFGGFREPWQGSIPGIPAQVGGPWLEDWTWVHQPQWDGPGLTRFRLPTPLRGPRWIEGYPALDGAWDRHHVLLGADGTTWELIGANRDTRTCIRMARWTGDGQLMEGKPVTAGGHPIFSTLLGVDEPPHRLAITLPDYSRDGHADGGPTDGTALWPWPKVGTLLRLKEDAFRRAVTLGGQVARVAGMAHHCGVWVEDKTGVPGTAWIVSQAGAWSSTFAPWRLSDFEPAISL